MLELRNPHSILAAIRVRPRAVKSIRVQTLNSGDAWDQVTLEARQNGIPVQVGAAEREVPRKHFGRSGGKVGGRPGGTPETGQRETERVGAGSAQVEPPSPVPLDVLWKTPETAENGADAVAADNRFGLWLALDQVQDPQNLGAIFRLAGFFGIRGIILTKDRSAPVNATVCDVATGGVEYVAHSVVANLAQAIEKSRQNDIWVLGTCERATVNIQSIGRDRHWMLVMGNEGTGLRRLTREKCDQLVGFPPLGPVTSLNVATATAACLALLTSARV